MAQIQPSLSLLSQRVHMLTHTEATTQARLLLETAPAPRQFQQLFQYFDFIMIFLRERKAQRKQLSCIMTCAPTSEQGWNCSWLPQSWAKATYHKSQGRSGYLTCNSLCRQTLDQSSSLLLVGIYKTLLLISPWTKHSELQDEFYFSQVFCFYGFWPVLQFSPQQSLFYSTDKPCLSQEQQDAVPSPLPAPPPCPRQS